MCAAVPGFDFQESRECLVAGQLAWRFHPEVSYGSCMQVAYTLALQYLDRDYFKPRVCTISAHGPVG